jgi:protein kinase-like protein
VSADQPSADEELTFSDDAVAFSDEAEGGGESAEAAPLEPDIDAGEVAFADERETDETAPLPEAPDLDAGEVSFADDPVVSPQAKAPGPKPPGQGGVEDHGLSFSDSQGGEALSSAPAAKRAPRPSARLKALQSSSRNRALTPKAAKEIERRQRSPADAARALADAKALIQPVPEGDPYLGKEVGPFKATAFLGLDRGVRTYLGHEEESQDSALIRVYPLKGSYGEELSRLATRAERVARAASPSFAICLGAGRIKDAFFVGHELPLGATLEELLAQDVRFSEEELLLLTEQVATGLGMIHTRELVHGDVSVATIRRERPGSYVLCDSGLGRVRPELTFLSAGGEVVGTPGFLAPEVVDSGKVLPPAELYALGCVLWTLIMGKPAFASDDAVQSLLDQLNQELPPLEPPEGTKISEGFKVLVGKLTGYVPAERYGNVSDLLSDIRKVRAGDEIAPIPKQHKGAESEGAPARANSGIAILLALVLANLVLLGLAGMAVLQASDATLPDPSEGLQVPLPGISPSSK